MIENDSYKLNFCGPLTISWDLTNRCNLNCRHCFNRSGDNNVYNFSKEMDEQTARQIVNQIIELRPETVCLCGGEPTLSPYFLLIASLLSKENIKVNMVSNGTLIDEKLSSKIKQANFNSVQISLDSHLSSFHDEFRGLNGCFEKAINAIKLLKNQRVFVAVSMCPTKFNVCNFDDYVDLVSKELNVDMIRIMPLLPLGRASNNLQSLLPSAEEYFLLKSKIYKYKKQGINIEWGDPLDHIRKAYDFKRTVPLGLDIKSNCDLGISAYLPIVVGNVKRHRLIEYWKSGLNNVWGKEFVTDMIKDINSIYDLSLLVNKIVVDLIDDSSKL